MIRDNDRDREEDRQRPHDPISEHLLWLMMNHIRRRQVDNFKQILESRPQRFLVDEFFPFTEIEDCILQLYPGLYAIGHFRVHFSHYFMACLRVKFLL